MKKRDEMEDAAVQPCLETTRAEKMDAGERTTESLASDSDQLGGRNRVIGLDQCTESVRTQYIMGGLKGIDQDNKKPLET